MVVAEIILSIKTTVVVVRVEGMKFHELECSVYVRSIVNDSKAKWVECSL